MSSRLTQELRLQFLLRLQWLNSEFGFFWTLLIKVKSFENASLRPKFSALQPGEVLISLPSLFIKISSDLYHSRVTQSGILGPNQKFY